MLDMFGFYINGVAIKDAYMEARTEKSLYEDENYLEKFEDVWEDSPEYWDSEELD